MDEDLCIVHANAHAESLLRAPAFLLQGRPAAKLFFDWRAVESLLRREVLAPDLPLTGLPPTYLLRNTTQIGEQRLWRVQVQVLCDEQLGTFVLMQITEPRARPRYPCRKP